MGLADLSGKLDSSDVDKVKLKRNPPEYEDGFSGGIDVSSDVGNDADFDSLFDGIDAKPLDVGQSDGFNGFDNAGGFDSMNGTNPVLAGFGFDANNNTPQEPIKDRFDLAMDASIDGAKSTGIVLKETAKSFKNRTADDVAYLGRNYIIVGFAISGIAFAIRIIEAIGKLNILNGLFMNLGFAGLVVVCMGLIAMGLSALYLEKNQEAKRTLDDIPDIESEEKNFKDYEDNIDDVLDELFSMEDDEDEASDDGMNFDDFDSFDNDDESEKSDDNFNMDFSMNDLNLDDDKESNIKNEETTKDYNECLNDISSNQLINRASLFHTWKNLLVRNTPNFSDRTEIDQDSKEFALYETVCIKALANASKKEIEEIDSHLDRMEDSMSSTDLYVKRIKANPKKEDIAKEIEFYLKDSEDDDSISATASIVGDFYKITIIKKNENIVTIGDALQKDNVSKFFEDTNNKVPMIIGVNLKGEVVFEDAKAYNAMMITGRPRSGKSWFVLATLFQMMMFNPPSEVTFCIVDPKESTLFSTLSLMPHVIGLHNDENILEIMKDIIDNEGARRAKILKDNRCDNIWDLRKKGIELPLLYLVMDEVITIKENLGAASKEFDGLLQVLISKLPYVGIRVLFIAHRAQGIISKTSRAMLDYTVSVMGKPEEVDETLDTKNFPIRLINAGEMGVKTSKMKEAIFARSVAVTTSDKENEKFIKMVASGFYKMGVEIPENVCLDVAYNRDEDKVRQELTDGNRVIQYDVLADLDS